MLDDVIEKVRKLVPLIHCITNYVTVNDVANSLLAAGGSPIMADDLGEVEEMTSLCQGLVLNIGTLNRRTTASMLSAGKKANELGHVVVLDPVGAGASKLRTETALQLIKEIHFDVIKGNISEIKTLVFGDGNTQGVDAAEGDGVTEENLDEMICFARKLSERTGAIIAITGAIDLVVNTSKAYVIRNGNPLMAKITGTGCMLTGIMAAYVAAHREKAIEAAVMAISAMGYCGEIAYEKLKQIEGGTSTYKMLMIDEISKLTDEKLKGGCKIEVR
ncbi:hydroxyethylthiazole kinase [Cellulosilyticum sp. WCF-2]|uniref:hydroxyethylthiazole kinase n=1 Tax=Cellulosilyticum sp. WCF-2 TaxID=2497860 RepID=UPI000F8E2B80|nr:hydroxyethylthiazole kinase [Cellulosilyticum sp. WCF-2]QEH70319.1 hydroxyethylthiazole kinase [Cellulosilyticum sp. WCF-2]